MSKSGSIIIRLSSQIMDEAFFHAIIEALKANKWSLDIKGKFIYMTNGSFDIDFVTADRLHEKYQEVLDSIANGHSTSVRLSLLNTAIEVELLFANSEKIVFSLLDEIVVLRESGIVDFSFYLEKFAEALKMIAYNSIQCLYD